MQYDKAYFAAYYQKHKERIKARVAAYRQANPEKAKAAVRAWFANPENKEHIREKAREYARKTGYKYQKRHAATEKAKRTRALIGKRWRENNPHKNSAKSNAYRAAKECRVPKWLTADDRWMIEEIYELAEHRSKVTGVRHVVDHVIPLKGRTVSGLHVPTNLQVITAGLNALKGNKYPFTV